MCKFVDRSKPKCGKAPNFDPSHHGGYLTMTPDAWYGATPEPNQAITSDQEIPWLSGCVVVGFVATAAINQVVAMVTLVATEPTLVATEA